jgi:hypothetical protein
VARRRKCREDILRPPLLVLFVVIDGSAFAMTVSLSLLDNTECWYKDFSSGKRRAAKVLAATVEDASQKAGNV